MAQKVVIDVEARFVDNISDESKAASKSVEGIGKSAEKAQKQVDGLGKKKVKPIFDAENSKLLKKIRDSEKKAEQLGRKKTQMVLTVLDKATNIIGNVLNKAQNIAGKVWRGIVAVKDSGAVATLREVGTLGKNIAGKTWRAVVKITDLATTPLRKLKDTLFSIKGLVATITAGLAAKQFIINPINLADSYSSAQIGFTTLLGEKGGQEMMDKIDEFAKATPFKTSGVISNVQKMMAYGWDVDRVIKDMETIGDAAAATGKGDEGLESIVYALSEIRSKGKLSTQELNQLASAGIKAKAYLAEGLGYGTSDEGMAELAKDLESGAIGANQAIDLILQGMEEFDGMMDKTANETVEGLMSQIEDTFEINVFRRWGQGLQDGAKKGLGSVVDLLNESEEGLQDLGDMLYEVGQMASQWFAEKVGDAVDLIKEITGSEYFKNADLGGKIKMLWDGLIANPFAQWWENTIIPWWDNTAIPWLADKAQSMGEAIGTGLSNILLTLFGVAPDVVDAGLSIGGSFAKGFVEGFDGQAVTDAFVKAISDVWNALPAWAKLLIGGYGISKLSGVISPIVGLVKGVSGGIGSASGLTGLLGFGANAAINMGAGNLANGASLGAGTMSALGLGATAGYATGAVTLISGISDLYNGFSNDDSTKKATGGWKVGGTAGGAALGAAIGSVIPGVGTVVGAGIGALAGAITGWWKSSDIEAEAQRKAEEAAEEQMKLQERAATQLKSKFGDIQLSAAQVKRSVSEMIGQELIDQAYAASAAIDAMYQSFDSFTSADQSVKKIMWSAAYDEQPLDESGQQEVKDSAKAFTSSATQFWEDTRYASQDAISALMGDSEEAEKVMKASLSYYDEKNGELKKAIADFNTELGKALEPDENGEVVITVNEQESLDKMRSQISNLMTELAKTEYDASMNATFAKYSGGKGAMSLESFSAMQEEMHAQANTLADAFWDQFGVASIGLEKGGEEWNALWGSTLDNIAPVWQKSADFGLDTLQEKFSEELGILGEDVSEIMKNNTFPQIQEAINGMDEADLINIGEWVESMEPTTAQIEMLKSSYEELGMALPEGLQSYLNTVEFYEALAAGPEAIQEYYANHEFEAECKPTLTLPSPDELLSGQADLLSEQDIEIAVDAYADLTWYYNELSGEITTPDGGYTFSADALMELGWTYNEFDQTWISPNGSYSFNTDVRVDSVYNTTPFPGISEFGVSPAYSVPTTTGVNATYNTTQFPGISAFGIQSTYSTSPTVNVSPVYKTLNDYVPNYIGEKRGGIVGPNGPEGFAKGGMVRGGAQLITVAEEGTPEMIIPLGSQRRDRALKLWAKAGEMLGVNKFARGGMTDGSSDEGFRFRSFAGQETTSEGNNVQIDVGGVHVDIHVDGNGYGDVAEAIRAQSDEIAETVAGILADAFGSQFENTPARGGAA